MSLTDRYICTQVKDCILCSVCVSLTFGCNNEEFNVLMLCASVHIQHGGHLKGLYTSYKLKR